MIKRTCFDCKRKTTKKMFQMIYPNSVNVKSWDTHKFKIHLVCGKCIRKLEKELFKEVSK